MIHTKEIYDAWSNNRLLRVEFYSRHGNLSTEKLSLEHADTYIQSHGISYLSKRNMYKEMNIEMALDRKPLVGYLEIGDDEE